MNKHMSFLKKFSDEVKRGKWTVYQTPRPVWNWLGYFAIACTLAATIAQIVSIAVNRSADQIPYLTIGLTMLVQCMWLAYGIGNGIPASVISSVAGLITLSIILCLKIVFEKRNRKVQI